MEQRTATFLLRREHEMILRMVEATEEVAKRLEAGDSVSPDTLSGLFEFFRLFADRAHHEKEEGLLFPLLEKRGVPRSGGLIGILLCEHEQGRAMNSQLEEAGNAYKRGSAEAGRQWAKLARDLAGFLRQHIATENDVLFPLAERLLSVTEQEKLAAAFDQVQANKMGAGTEERLRARMGRLLGQIFPETRQGASFTGS